MGMLVRNLRTVVRNLVGSLVLLVALAGLNGATALASPAQGTPGEPNCRGETVSFAAQWHGGIVNSAEFHGFASVQNLQKWIRNYCSES